MGAKLVAVSEEYYDGVPVIFKLKAITGFN